MIAKDGKAVVFLAYGDYELLGVFSSRDGAAACLEENGYRFTTAPKIGYLKPVQPGNGQAFAEGYVEKTEVRP